MKVYRFFVFFRWQTWILRKRQKSNITTNIQDLSFMNPPIRWNRGIARKISAKNNKEVIIENESYDTHETAEQNHDDEVQPKFGNLFQPIKKRRPSRPKAVLFTHPIFALVFAL